MNPNTPFTKDGVPLPFSVGAFWGWGFSDLLLNTTRGAIAEFIVSKALGSDAPPRDVWSSFDLRSPANTKIEVKSASCRQYWGQKRDSDIRFGIAPTQEWNAETVQYQGESKRQAEVYIFCVLDNRQPHARDPLELARWRFHVLATKVLDATLNGQKSIGLRSLLALNPTHCAFDTIAESVEDVFTGATTAGTVDPPKHRNNQPRRSLHVHVRCSPACSKTLTGILATCFPSVSRRGFLSEPV